MHWWIHVTHADGMVGIAHPSFTKTTVWPRGLSLLLPSGVKRKLAGSIFGA